MQLSLIKEGKENKAQLLFLQQKTIQGNGCENPPDLLVPNMSTGSTMLLFTSTSMPTTGSTGWKTSCTLSSATHMGEHTQGIIGETDNLWMAVNIGCTCMYLCFQCGCELHSNWHCWEQRHPGSLVAGSPLPSVPPKRDNQDKWRKVTIVSLARALTGCWLTSLISLKSCSLLSSWLAAVKNSWRRVY